jgi:hypothetical protein
LDEAQRVAAKVSVSFDADELDAIEWLRTLTPARKHRSVVLQELVEREMRERFGPKWREAFRARIAGEVAA